MVCCLYVIMSNIDKVMVFTPIMDYGWWPKVIKDQELATLPYINAVVTVARQLMTPSAPTRDR